MFLKRNREKDRVINTTSLDFPNGVVVETVSGNFYYIKNDIKIKIIDDVILASWRIVNVPLFADEALKNKITAGNLKLRDGTVINYNNKNYYASDGKLRSIDDDRWYQWLNINDNDIINISDKVFNLHQIGDPLN